MIEMTYHNDHKEKWQSHEIEIRENGVFSAEIDDGIWVSMWASAVPPPHPIGLWSRWRKRF